MLYKGQEIKIVNKDKKVQYTGTVKSISRTRKVVTITRRVITRHDDNGHFLSESRFYRDDRQGSDRKTYIDSPGAGIFGHMLNDRFVEPPVATKKVTNLMSGKEVEIAEDTPRCCDPSSELYWSM